MTVLFLEQRRFADARGWFAETWHRGRLLALGVEADFCQDNHSYSAMRGTLRGIHYQRRPWEQAKLVRCTRGSIFDVAVDLRSISPTYGRWVGAVLTAEGGEQLFIPRGYGHAFLTLEDDCEVQYKVDAYYCAEGDSGVSWDDPTIGIEWPINDPVLSEKDRQLPRLAQAAPDFAYDGRPLGPISALPSL
jgi:dTDP-4-dehydrorhamnose 3,5-epimerase